MKQLVVVLLFSSNLVLHGQLPHDHGQCARSEIKYIATHKGLSHPSLPSVNANQENQRPANCAIENLEQFATFEPQELFDYLIDVEDPQRCVYRILYDFHTDHSPSIFTDEKVSSIAQQSRLLASQFDGNLDNGIYAIFSYLSMASLHATFRSTHITLSEETWSSIRDVCKDFSDNPHVDGDTRVSYFAIAHMFFTASFGGISSDPSIVRFSKSMLQRLAENSFLGSQLEDLYPYYYCYYYIIDLYHRYPQVETEFIEALLAEEGTILALGDVAINLELDENTYTHFDDLSLTSVNSLSRYAPHEALREEVEPSLNDITNTYPDDDARWVTAALSIVQNDMPFVFTEEEILSSIASNVLPHTYILDDGRMIVNTALNFDEVMALHQSAKEVESQFFSMIGDNTPLDQQDTLFVRIYGSHDDYKDYNHLLYGVNYPHSGGVYIEDHTAIYTYDRTVNESVYSLEELFRHEYVHYLQGKYLVAGRWGQSPIYDNSRLVWFEEGMAQFLAGSTRMDNVKALAVIKDGINEDEVHQELSSVLSSSYGSGNSAAYYLYAPLFWSKLFYEEHNRSIEFIQYIRSGSLNQFDNLVETYKQSPYEQMVYQSYIDSLLADTTVWFSPITIPPLPHHLDTTSLEDLVSSFEETVAVSASSSSILVQNQPRRFRIEGTIAIQSATSDHGDLQQQTRSELNDMLLALSEVDKNNFQFATAYHHDLQPDPTSAGTFLSSYFLEGPINDVCRPINSDQITINTLQDTTWIIPPPSLSEEYHLRYRVIGARPWISLDPLIGTPFLLTDLNGHQPYEYQMSYSCSIDSWAPYTLSRNFLFCPSTLSYEADIMNNLTLQAEQLVRLSSHVLDESLLQVTSGQTIEINPTFLIDQGAVMEINLRSCIED